jgi:hypothetical protein
VTNPLVGMQTLHLPVTTQEVLRVSPVPLHSGQITWPLPLQRGQVAVSTAGFDGSIVPPLKDLEIPGYSCQRWDGFEKQKTDRFSVGFTIDSPLPK